MNSQFNSQARFETTNWSIVLAAGRESSQDAKQALETLCQSYWFPLYAFARKRGKSRSDAKDSVQSFVLLLLQRNDFAIADPEKGKFRTFLLKAFSNFLANEYDFQTAIKRGGKETILSINWEHAETRYSVEPQSEETPEKIFHRQWALSVLQSVIQQVKHEYQQTDRSDQFDVLSPWLAGNQAGLTYESVAEDLKTTVSSVKSAIHRMRKRYRQIMREQIAETVTSNEGVDDEIRELFQAISLSNN